MFAQWHQREICLRGNINWQVQEIFNKSGINQIGNSKHSVKETIRSTLNSQNQSVTWHKIGKEIGIYSYSTADAYRDVWKQIGEYIKSEFKIKDFEIINGNHIQSFLESKIVDGIAHSTFMQYAAACEKLESALNGYAGYKDSGKNYNFSEYISNTRSDAHNILERFDGSRAYDAPQSLINNIQNEKHKLAALMQYESGARINEISLIKHDQLNGSQPDNITGEMKGYIEIEGKGGKENTIALNLDTYQKLENYIQNDGEFRIDKDDYRDNLKEVSEKTEQDYNGSHGLRWSFAQERFQDVQRYGLNYEEALQIVSQELGHERSDITEHYLK
jgi:integrase